MRILGLRIRHRIFGDLAGLRIQLADERAGVAGVPDVSLAILLEAVRAGVRSLERILLHFAGLGIDAAEHVRHLAGVPERAIARRHGIVRPRPRRRHLPGFHRHLDRSRYQHRIRPAFDRVGLRQVVPHQWQLVRRDGHAVIGHHAQHGVPTFGRISRADARADRMAAIALGVDHGLADVGGVLRPRGRGKRQQRGCEQCRTAMIRAHWRLLFR